MTTPDRTSLLPRRPALRLRVARGFLQRLRGLLGTRSLPPDEAFLIEPCNGVHTLGMRYAIDVVFVDREGRIAKVVEALAPGRVAWCLRANKVYELAAGGARRHGMVQGDRCPLAPAAALHDEGGVHDACS